MKDMGRVISIDGNTFTTSNGTTFEFPFDVPPVSVSELNDMWQKWAKIVEAELEQE